MTLDDINRIASEYLNDCESTFEMEELFELAKKGLVFDKIRAEIEQEYKKESEHPYGQGLRRAIEIIDKYKGESEDEE